MVSGLDKIIEELNRADCLNNEEVVEIIKDAKIRRQDVAKYSFFGHAATESYGRKTIHENEKLRIMLMSWCPGDFTAIHNHGTTEWGGVLFFGKALHRLYNENNQKLQLEEKTICEVGDILPVCGDVIHLMGNFTNKEFVTLHIYGKNHIDTDSSQGNVVYLPEHQTRMTTQGAAFIGENNKAQFSEQFFNNIDEAALTDYLPMAKTFYQKRGNQNMLSTIDKYLQFPQTYYQKS